MINKFEVFISYSSKDEEIAVMLYNAMKEHHIYPWIALYDIDYGSNYAKEIFGAIESAKVFSVIISANSCESDHVKNEIELATRQIKNGMTIMPIRIDHKDMDEELQYYLARKQWLDASNPPIQEKINKYCEQICTILNNKCERLNLPNNDLTIKVENESVEDYKKYALVGEYDNAIKLLEIELEKLHKLKELYNEDKKGCSALVLGLIDRKEPSNIENEVELRKKHEELLYSENELCNKLLYKYNQLGFFYDRNNNYEKALEYYKKALELSPKNPSIHERIASTYMNLENYNEALTEYSHTLIYQRAESGAYNKRTLLSRSNALYKLGRDELALRDYNDAMKY